MAEIIVERAYFPRRGRGEIQVVPGLFAWCLLNTKAVVVAYGHEGTQDDAASAMRRRAAELGWAGAMDHG